jgi:NAD-dependent deacetylase
MSILYITGAGVSAESGIPTFRGKDGFWTIGSVNYTPQEMATRAMYLTHPDEFPSMVLPAFCLLSAYSAE